LNFYAAAVQLICCQRTLLSQVWGFPASAGEVAPGAALGRALRISLLALRDLVGKTNGNRRSHNCSRGQSIAKRSEFSQASFASLAWKFHTGLGGAGDSPCGVPAHPARHVAARDRQVCPFHPSPRQSQFRFSDQSRVRALREFSNWRRCCSRSASDVSRATRMGSPISIVHRAKGNGTWKRSQLLSRIFQFK
jgi:hypothetical protein